MEFLEIHYEFDGKIHTIKWVSRGVVVAEGIGRCRGDCRDHCLDIPWARLHYKLYLIMKDRADEPIKSPEENRLLSGQDSSPILATQKTKT